ncbi:MBL fold metallo-hydrolase [Rhodocytophaga aerolata]|uniref:MBL fold metallo-hydrolase n=1 Tax=Rhodocytophaga aerolata TaxID=455078 RepID=A0ABT8RD38_9BACT|nr:MBL fold metallo-hydrolase [Rhodocytophaga aerolata]MDO1449621.1 MBL fold metallo-hydrolase [Rhodocytophaga aerolata]
METTPTLDVTTLRNWLENGKPVTILDVRPLAERQEWAIPGSIHVDVYDKLKAGDEHALDNVNVAQHVPVVTVCAAGRMSLKAAGQLQAKGLEVYSLEGGMKAWSLAWNTAIVPTSLPQVSILQIRRTGKGCLSYMVASEGEALVIDASLDEKVYLDLAMMHGWQITYVLDTHLHADHLSRSRVLALQTGAKLLLPESDKFQFSYEPVTSQTTLPLGKTLLKAIPTPGHTLESFSYLVGESVLFSGDTLFVDGIGRPDLKASADEIRQKATLLHRSLHTLLALPESLQVLPGHTSKPVAFDEEPIVTTIGELAAKLSWVKVSEEAFAQTLLAKIPATPPNYLTISELNRGGDFSGIEPMEVEAGANRCAIS